MVVILSVLDSFARGVYAPRRTTVLTFVHRYVIAFRCGATSGAIYCPLSLLSRICKSRDEIYSCLFMFSFYFGIYTSTLILSFMPGALRHESINDSERVKYIDEFYSR